MQVKKAISSLSRIDPDLVRRVIEELEHFEAVSAELPAEKDVDKVGVGDDVDLDIVGLLSLSLIVNTNMFSTF